MAIKFKSESEKNKVVTYLKVTNAKHAASCTHMLLLRICLIRPINTISNWTFPSIACVIAYKQKEELKKYRVIK
jgi:hypothetical protein